MIGTDRLRLRPWRESDLEFLQSLRNDIELQALLLAAARGSSVLAIRKWLDLKSSSADSFFFIAELSQTNELIGYIQLCAVANADKTIQFGVCLATQYWSNGYGAELLQGIEKYLQIHHDTRKIMLHVDATNSRAVSCYRKLGYREVGVMRSHVRVQARLCDVLIMEKLTSRETEGVI